VLSTSFPFRRIAFSLYFLLSGNTPCLLKELYLRLSGSDYRGGRRRTRDGNIYYPRTLQHAIYSSVSAMLATAYTYTLTAISTLTWLRPFMDSWHCPALRINLFMAFRRLLKEGHSHTDLDFTSQTRCPSLQSLGVRRTSSRCRCTPLHLKSASSLDATDATRMKFFEA
jgi:hypothetical protein